MIGSTAIKNHIKDSQSLDIKPRIFLEINNNDCGIPYFYGTGSQTATTLAQLSLSLSNASGTPAAVDAGTVTGYAGRGIETSLTTPNNNAYLLKTNSSPSQYIEYQWYADTSSGERFVKFNMFLKSDYEYQVSSGDNLCLESFDVVLVAQGFDSSGKAVLSETITETITVDSVDWKPVSILFANPDEYAIVDKVRLSIHVSPQIGYKSALLVGQLVRSVISDYEVYSNDRIPVSEIFEPGRPGEFLIEMSSSIEATPPAKPTIQGIAQQCTPIHMATYYALGPKYEFVQRSVTPFQNNPYTYYVSGTNVESKKVWAIYKNKVKTNKIVLKFNTIAVKPSSINLSILTNSGWSNNIANGVTINSDGTVILYYNGSSWSTTKWTSSSYPTISTSSSNAGNIILGASNGYQEIWGIKLDASTLTTTNSDFSELTPRLELIEVSPRLDVDLTNFVMSVSSISESSSDSLLNIGGITSNSYNITLSNNLIIKNLHDPSSSDPSNPDVRPVSALSSTSTFNNILTKGAKIRGGFDIDLSYRGKGILADKTYVPSFVGYIDKWNENNDTITINAFDIIKNLQSTNTEPIFLESKRVSECIYSVLDPVGFGEVYGDQLINLKAFEKDAGSELTFSQNEKIKYFWTSNDRTVSETLNDLFKVYQIAMYTDEYGAVRFNSLYEYNEIYKELTKSASPKLPDIYIQDKNDSNSKSNLIGVDIEENEKPESIIIKYRTPRPTLSQPPPRKKAKKDNKPVKENTFVTQRPSTDRVWILQDESFVVPYIQLSSPGITSVSQNYIPYDISLTNIFMRAIPYSSYLLIDEEILSYDGLEYEFKYTTNTGSSIKKYIVKNKEELDMIKSDIFSNKSGRSISFSPTGKLMNVKRGLFGTPPSIHSKQSSSTTNRWLMKKFNFSSNSYNNATSALKFVGTANGINVTSNNSNEMLFLYPKDDVSDANLMKDKRRLLCQFKLGDIPSNKEGYVGVGIGMEINGSGELIGGLLVWVGVELNKNKQNPTVYVEQIKPNGEIEVVIEKDQFKYSDRVIEENENIEIYIALNEQRDECKVLVGGSTAFEKIISKKEGGKKKEIKQHRFKIRQLSGRTTFGFIANGFGVATLGQYLFGASDRYEDMSNINLSIVDDIYYSYNKNNSPTGTYFIGSNNLLDTIVDGRNVAGLRSTSKHNFVYTGAPIGRGIQIFDIEYDKFPVIASPVAKWTGYSYDSNIFEGGNIISDGSA